MVSRTIVLKKNNFYNQCFKKTKIIYQSFFFFFFEQELHIKPYCDKIVIRIPKLIEAYLELFVSSWEQEAHPHEKLYYNFEEAWT